MTETPPATPEPVVKAAAVWGTVITAVVSGLGVLVAVGFLSAEQTEAITFALDEVSTSIVPVGVSIVGIVGVVSGLASGLVTAAVGRRKVRPIPDQDRVA